MRKYKWLLVAATAAVVLGIAWYAFRPELLFINARADERLPPGSTADARPVALTSGSFHGVAHATKGTATVYRLAGGKRILRLTDFETSNGPDVHVYLVAADDAADSDAVTRTDVIDLGSMKGNVGDQNYDVSDEVDLQKFRAATIWCKRFAVNFATAPLTPAAP
jgi:hypothetical protein